MSAPESFNPRLSGQVLAPAGSGIVLAEWTAEGRVDLDEPPMHQAPLHSHGEDEAWYVLEGMLGVRIGDEDVEVPAGGAAIVPGGAAHTYWNPLAQSARYLLVMGTETYALIRALHSGRVGRGSEEMRELFRAHNATLLG